MTVAEKVLFYKKLKQNTSQNISQSDESSNKVIIKNSSSRNVSYNNTSKSSEAD